MAQQLHFDLPAMPDYSRSGFVTAPSNAVAFALVADWQAWPNGKMALTGPHGAGKTHLAHVWTELVGGVLLPAAELPAQDLTALADCHVAVEDVPNIARDMAAQEALFHLHNMMQVGGRALLLTGVGTPNHWGMGLPDLQSRIDAAGHARLDPPDDALLAAVLEKHFADRQLAPRADVIPYLLPRMERSFAAARAVVAALDTTSLREGKAITRRMAAAILDNS